MWRRDKPSWLPTARYRPVSIPDDVDDPGLVKASGRVRLPLRLYWSGPHPEQRMWDLDDPVERAYVSEIVMREGTDEDVRRFIDLDELIAMWPRLFLPAEVRQAWLNSSGCTGASTWRADFVPGASRRHPVVASRSRGLGAGWRRCPHTRREFSGADSPISIG
jgi:hypothetical protein